MDDSRKSISIPPLRGSTSGGISGADKGFDPVESARFFGLVVFTGMALAIPVGVIGILSKVLSHLLAAVTHLVWSIA